MSQRQMGFGPPPTILHNLSTVSGEGGPLLTIGHYFSQLRPVNYRDVCELTLYSTRRYKINLSYLGSSF
jgi:hypothetical protein